MLLLHFFSSIAPASRCKHNSYIYWESHSYKGKMLICEQGEVIIGNLIKRKHTSADVKAIGHWQNIYCSIGFKGAGTALMLFFRCFMFHVPLLHLRKNQQENHSCIVILCSFTFSMRPLKNSILCCK